MVEILPGEITDPNWPGPRCGLCARPIGGDGSTWRTCEDMPQPHATMEGIPPEMRFRFYVDRCWDNVVRMVGLLDALDWMTAGRKGGRPIDLLRKGEGEQVLQRQFKEWPRLEQEVDRMRRMRGGQIAPAVRLSA